MQMPDLSGHTMKLTMVHVFRSAKVPKQLCMWPQGCKGHVAPEDMACKAKTVALAVQGACMPSSDAGAAITVAHAADPAN